MASPDILSELEKIEIERADLVTLNFYYKEITGADIGSCPLCKSEAVALIKKWIIKQGAKKNGKMKYRFKYEYKTTEVVMRIGDNKVIINEGNLTEANAQRLMADTRYAGLLELNPDFGKVEEKKSIETNTTSKDSTSTLTEVQSEENILKKRGRKPKLV